MAADVAALRKTIITFFEAAMVDDQIVLPYAKQGCSAMCTTTRACSPRTTTPPAGS
jgi:hypothetical protein